MLIILIFCGILLFMVTSLLISAVYVDSWGNEDLDIMEEGRSYIELDDIGPGALYVRAFCIDSGYMVPGYDPEDGERNTYVTMHLTFDDRELESSEAMIWEKYNLPTKGDVKISCTNSDGFSINVRVWYVPHVSRIFACSACCVLPLFAMIFAVYLIAASLGKRRTNREIEKQEKPKIKMENDLEDTRRMGEDYYRQRWKDP